MNRTLVDRALAKASECEKKNDTAGVEKWMKVAEEAERAYDKQDEVSARLRANHQLS